MLKLNDIDDEGASKLTRFYTEMLQGNQHPLTRYEAHFNIGLVAWRAQNLDSFRQHMNEAVTAMLECLYTDKNTANETRIPHHVVLPFFIVMIFGNQEQRKKLAELDRKDFFFTENNQYKSLADLLDSLRQYFAGGALSLIELNKIITVNEGFEADSFYQPWVAAMSIGLISVVEKDRITAEKSMRRLLQLHELLAWEQGWERLAEGLFSFWASALRLIAKNENFPIDTESDYMFKNDFFE